MTLECTKTNLKRGSKGETVKELQTLLKKLGYYTGVIDGDYGNLTEEAVKKYQKTTGTLAVDGIVGPITCKHLQKNSSDTSGDSYYKNGIYHSGKPWTSSGCNKIGQCNGYFCACCCIRQTCGKWNIDNYTQQKIGQYAGTTSAGTSHWGIETALAKIASNEGIKLRVEWKNFSDMGNTSKERWEALGKILATQNKSIIWHTLFKDKWGHYETVQEVNMNNGTVKVLNSLGSKCNSPAYCGYIETRSWSTMERYLRGISQKSICIITKE